MSTKETRDSVNDPEYEGEAILLRGQVKDLEREKAETAEEDKRYKNAQLKVNSRIALFSLLLVVCTAATGGISIWQATIAQTAATAAKDAARAASENANTAAYALLQSEWSSDFTLEQMEAQSAAQDKAASSSIGSLQFSRKSFRISERPFVTVEALGFDKAPKDGIKIDTITQVQLTLVVVNSGHTPALDVAYRIEMLLDGKPLNEEEAVKGETVIPYGHPTRKNYIVKLPNSDVPNLAKKDFLIVEGMVRYTDIFGDWHPTSFCYTYDGNENTFRAGVSKACLHGNSVR